MVRVSEESARGSRSRLSALGGALGVSHGDTEERRHKGGFRVSGESARGSRSRSRLAVGRWGSHTETRRRGGDFKGFGLLRGSAREIQRVDELCGSVSLWLRVGGAAGLTLLR